jgi:hypothetical protein
VKSSKETFMKSVAFIRLSGIVLIAAGLSGFTDAVMFDLNGTILPIAIMFFTLIGSAAGVAYFHFKSTSRLAGILTLIGFLLILVNFPMYGRTIGAYSFAFGILLVGIPFLLLGNHGRWVSIIWFMASFLSFPEFMHLRTGLFHNFLIFNAALLASGVLMIIQAGEITDKPTGAREPDHIPA